MPTSAATAATVSGRSPEMIRTRTPCDWRNSTVSRASARRRSPSTTSPSGSSITGSESASTRPRATPNATTRRPARASCVGERLQLARREELGRAEHVRRRAELQCAPAPPRRERHARARLLLDAAAVLADRLERRVPRAARSPRSARARARARPRRRRRAGTSVSTCSRASVSVPVLSRQIVSTEAIDSIAFSCCASAPRRAMRTAATAYVTLVRRISPSGTSVTTAATVVGTALWIDVWRRYSTQPSATPSGMSTPTSTKSSRLIDRSSGERGCRNSRASSGDARRVTLLTDGGHEVGARALDRERAGLDLLARALRHRLRFAGEDRLVEREPVAAPKRAVGDHLIACVEQHDVAVDDVFDAALAAVLPSRNTFAVGATSAARRSSVRFARTSCAMPMPAFATRIARKSASCTSPNASVSTPAASRIRLKTVKTFATTMLLYERLDVVAAGGRAASLRSASCCVSPAARDGRRHASSVAATKREAAGRRRSVSRTSLRASRCGRECPCAARG